MTDYPILLNLQGRLCIVVGAGPVGMRKARGLSEAGAKVRLISPEPEPAAGFREGLEVVDRPYRKGDLEGAFLAFAATANPEVNAAVAREARQRGILLNRADAPEEGDFALPAVLRRGDLSVAVSTAGGSPALASLVRDRIAKVFGPEWGVVLEIFAAIRRKRLTHKEKPEYNQEILGSLLDRGLPALIAADDGAGIELLLESLLGEGHSLADLDVRLSKGMP